jgi:hypothetical protein
LIGYWYVLPIFTISEQAFPPCRTGQLSGSSFVVALDGRGAGYRGARAPPRSNSFFPNVSRAHCGILALAALRLLRSISDSAGD